MSALPTCAALVEISPQNPTADDVITASIEYDARCLAQSTTVVEGSVIRTTVILSECVGIGLPVFVHEVVIARLMLAIRSASDGPHTIAAA
jgi:hypothetical protein